MFNQPANWTRQEGYPTLNGNGAGGALVDAFYAKAQSFDEILRDIPRIGRPYYSGAINPDLRSLVFSSYDIKYSQNKSHFFITLNYSPASGGSIIYPEYQSFFRLRDAPMELALEKHPAYLMNWNYQLYQYKTIGESGQIPTWWETAKTMIDASGVNQLDEYAWAKSKPAGGTSDADWIWVADPTKPGVETYLHSAPTITENAWCKTEQAASKILATNNHILQPDVTFGAPPGEWLVNGVELGEGEKQLQVTRNFLWSEKWDEDLYDKVTSGGGLFPMT